MQLRPWETKQNFPLLCCKRFPNVSRLVEKNRRSLGGRITYQVFNCSASVFSHIRNCAEQHLLVVFGLRIKWVWGKAIGEEWGVLY